jgi:leucyl aminopeptidase
LTLADVLSYAAREKPDFVIDLATLTGACMVALGEEIAGLFVNNEGLKEKLMASANQAGEKLLELQLEDEYRDLIKSDFADLRNVGKIRYGGDITAALFLEEFVDKLPWAHLDIAGPSFAEKDSPLTPYGGTGFGVRLLIQFLKSL